MADPVIGATVQVLLEKLLFLTIEELSSSRDCKKDLEMLTQNASLIQAFIHDAERRQVDDQAVKLWLKMLERAAENAENVFDEFRYESIKRQVKIQKNPMKKVSDFISHTTFKSKMSRKINNINEELRAINKLAKHLGLQSLMVPPRHILPIRETDSVVVASEVVGRDNDVAEIKRKMLNIREDVVLCTIPIAGMGGLGKTTMAKRIFNDEQIEKHFEKRVWLCLPEMSETKSFLQLILESLTKRKVEVQSRDIIVKTLQDELAGRKYLLVLDDLWRVDSTLWVEFVDTLRGINTSRGNFILVTTRMEQVASTVAAVGPHRLEKLAEAHCWSIFKQRAFVDGEIPEEIVCMENRIVEMCQGLPLAASVLGGLLRNKEKHEWQAILDGNPLVAGPNNPTLDGRRLLHPCQETTVMEDIGNKFFQLLLRNSLLQDVKLDKHNNITHCKMHDLVHDLAGDILKYKLFDPKDNGGENLSQVRYFGWDSPSDQIDKITEPGRLCTLFWRSIYISEDMLLSFKFLRVLNLSSSGIKELSAKIGKCIHLRYLDLSNTEIRALPNSICELYNLQTFRVNGCYLLHELPFEMGNMISLRHIYCHSWYQMPLNMGQLTCLQTLRYFNVGLEKGRRIEELGCLKKLRGKLRINDLHLVRSREEARTAYLQEKSNIYKLSYGWLRDEPEGCETIDEHVLDGLQPHPNLKFLLVKDYLGTRFPSWFSEESLPNLVKLKLSECNRCKEIPSLGQLKFLRHLELIGFPELEFIGPTFYGVEVNDNGSCSKIQVFPSLKELILEDMCSLIEWKGVELIPTTSGVRMFPKLEKLRIANCQLLKSTPIQFEILSELVIVEVDSEMPLLNLCSNLTSLVKLSVYGVKKLTCFPDEMLRNNVSLQHLSVEKCGEFHELPKSLYNLHSLKRLWIRSCPNFSSFPVLSGENYLTSLQSLELQNCDGLTNLPSGMLEHCRSLESLSVYKCNDLVSFPLHVGEMHSLSYLGLSHCPKLICVPTSGLHRLTGLRHLEIGPFSDMVDFEAFQLIFNGIQQLSSLRTLGVWGHLHWDSLPYQLTQLSNLTDIKMYGFGIEALPHRFANLTSLERLTLVGCKRLQHMDFSDAMPKLRYLGINDCPLLEDLSDGLSNLVSLQKLVLQKCEKLEHLPSSDAMRRLTKLGYLMIHDWPLLEALSNGLGDLVSLQELFLQNCENLKHMPSRDAMRRLTKLRNLEIKGCPKLEESCTNRSGPNSQWSNISHIPIIKVGGSRIQDLAVGYYDRGTTLHSVVLLKTT
ncbi:hypothetical protein KY289_005842 [Solanum tuberosum]|nr:hypothetical protein KY289_005842 [Solanum tuberosum]